MQTAAQQLLYFEHTIVQQKTADALGHNNRFHALFLSL